MSAMATTRDPAHESVNLLTLLPQGLTLSDVSDPAYPSDLDTTRWLYHEPTGLLTNKVYADGDRRAQSPRPCCRATAILWPMRSIGARSRIRRHSGNGTAYAYTPDGELATRTWARGVTTSYGYATCCGSLTNILYSDSTPSVSFAYDRLGRQTNAVQRSTGVPPVIYGYRYDPATLALANEAIVAFGETNALARSQDALGRPAGIALSNPDTSTPPYALTYSYDTYGRFHSVPSSVFSVISAGGGVSP